MGQGNQPISQFPCLVALWILTCRPPQALVPPNQYIYAFVGPALAVMTAHWALAYGQNGRVHRARFVTGNVQATDLGIRTTLRDLTPYGYVRTAGSATAPRLGTGIGYVYQAEVENEGGGVALNATADITLPAGFTVNRIYPRSCSRSGTMVRCPLGALYADYSGLVSIWGVPTKSGAVTFRSTISSGATEPATDPNANSATTSAKVYGVPRTSIVRSLVVDPQRPTRAPSLVRRVPARRSSRRSSAYGRWRSPSCARRSELRARRRRSASG